MRRLLFTICLALSACVPAATDSETPLTPTPEAATTEGFGEATALQPAPDATDAPISPTIESSATHLVTGTAVPATSTSQPATPTTAATPTISASPTTGIVINGRTADGAYFLGRADAAVTIVDYSDFL